MKTDIDLVCMATDFDRKGSSIAEHLETVVVSYRSQRRASLVLPFDMSMYKDARCGQSRLYKAIPDDPRRGLWHYADLIV